MVSFNDVIVGSNGNVGIWKSQVFGHLQTLAYGLAKGNSMEVILEAISQQYLDNEIIGFSIFERCEISLFCTNSRNLKTKKEMSEWFYYNPKNLVILLDKSSNQKLINKAKIYVLKTYHTMNQLLQKLQQDALTLALLSLTPREWDVLMQSIQFLTNKEIADILCITPESVSNYKQRIKEKLHLDKGTGSLTKFLVNNLENIREIHTVASLLK